jgi:UDP-N-acetylglucosamine 1-carboxyvinyltransferase
MEKRRRHTALVDCFRITGGRPLEGEVRASGSKNAGLPLLAACLLGEGDWAFSRVPRLKDIDTMRLLLGRLGAGSCHGEDPDQVLLQVPATLETEAPYDIVRRMRASIAVLGPLLARVGQAVVPLPGGCVLGTRPIDIHLRGMEALGAEVELQHGVVHAQAPAGGLRGAKVNLLGPFGSTVLGTVNVMCAASLARGSSRLEGAACEPEVLAVGEFLQAAGAKISGLGTAVIEIEGVSALKPPSNPWQLPSDRIESGTLLLAAAMTSGRVRVTDCLPQELKALLDLLEQAGLPATTGVDWMELDARGKRPQAVDVQTAAYPGFATDLQAQWLAVATQAEGISTVCEGVYPERFMHVPELLRLGAKIERDGASARVHGPSALSGAPVLASDLRASAALVLAGLAAEGETLVRRVYHLDRGYQQLEEKLTPLGAEVRREVDEERP